MPADRALDAVRRGKKRTNFDGSREVVPAERPLGEQIIRELRLAIAHMERAIELSNAPDNHCVSNEQIMQIIGLMVEVDEKATHMDSISDGFLLSTNAEFERLIMEAAKGVMGDK
jgi:hypothetical protein